MISKAVGAPTNDLQDMFELQCSKAMRKEFNLKT
jgi:hypothetical protein